jgi:hypothetical protein
LDEPTNPMRVAALRLRLLAALVDAAVVIGGLAAVVGLVIAGVVAHGRIRGPDDEHECDDAEGQEARNQDAEGEDEASEIPYAAQEFRPSLQAQAALWGAGAGVAVAGRNWRGPGFRVVGLRRADAQTGGFVSVRSALIGLLFDQAWQAATRPLFRSRVQRRPDRISGHSRELRSLERKYADDPQARQRAETEFYKANAVNPFAGCGRQFAGLVTTQLVLALASPGGRTIRDRITGTTVVVDR